MKFENLEDLAEIFDWLLYIVKKGKVDLKCAQEDKKIDDYQSLHRYFKHLTAARLVNKVRRKEIVMGKPKDDYEISKEGFEFLKKLALKLNKELGLK